MMAVALIGVVAGMAVPVTGSALAGQRFRADAKALANLVGLTKMRASANFTRARVHANLANNSFIVERWDKTAAAWVQDEGVVRLGTGITFGFAGLAAPPPNTQAAIGMSPPCRTGIGVDDEPIAESSCIVFNSRGLPVDGAGVLFGGHALYLTDGGTVAAATVTATPRIRRWLTPAAYATWKELQ